MGLPIEMSKAWWHEIWAYNLKMETILTILTVRQHNANKVLIEPMCDATNINFVWKCFLIPKKKVPQILLHDILF